MTHDERPCHPVRVWIDRTFIFVEDAVYVGLGLVLAFRALSLLASGAVRIAHPRVARQRPSSSCGQGRWYAILNPRLTPAGDGFGPSANRRRCLK